MQHLLEGTVDTTEVCGVWRANASRPWDGSLSYLPYNDRSTSLVLVSSENMIHSMQNRRVEHQCCPAMELFVNHTMLMVKVAYLPIRANIIKQVKNE